MTALTPIYPLLAVHISDGVLTWPWLAGGFALAAVLAALAMIRVRDEEIPRIALMTAAFFVASLIHVKIGPTSAHLLLAGLLGVVLGIRAPLAVLIGVTLQAVLLGHGGVTVIGVNTCVMALPALGAALLFRVLHGGTRWAWFRFVVVVVSAMLWLECLVYCVACLVFMLLGWFHVAPPESGDAWVAAAVFALNPLTLAVVGVVGLAAALLERRLRHPTEFPAGLLAGMTAVATALALNTVVLRLGGAADSPLVVLLLFVAHIPIMAAEGVVLGFAVGFLARVKPEMLGGLRGGAWAERPAPAVAANGAITGAPASAVVAAGPSPPAPAGVPLRPPALLLLAVLGLLWTATPAHAHRLDAGYTVRPDGQVQVESWFDIGGQPPAGAKVQVFRPSGDVLAEGMLDEQGIFVFRPNGGEDLRVVVSAGAGHRAEFVVPGDKLPAAPGNAATPAAPSPPPTPMIPHTSQLDYKDVVVGLAFLLGLGAFVLSLRNMRHLQELRRVQEAAGRLSNPEPPAGVAPDDHFAAGKTSSSGTSH